MTKSIYPVENSETKSKMFSSEKVILRTPKKKKKSKLNAKTICTGCCCLLSIVLIVSGLLVSLFFRDLVQIIINSRVPLRPDSEVTSKWLKPPIKPQLKLYFFNVTNNEEFLRGEKPILSEAGPYVYDEIWEKANVTWLENGRKVEYGQKKSFFFNREKSIGSEDDVLIMPNIPVVAGISKMKKESSEFRFSFDGILRVLKQELFYRVTVKEMVWGHKHPVVELGNKLAKNDRERLPYDDFGLFIGKNGSYPGLIMALTGIEDVSRIGTVLSFENKEKLDFWTPGSSCNEIKGTDGSVFHPGVSKNETLFIFNKDLCRSLPLVFQKDIVANGGIPGYRFVPPSNVFGTPDENPFNSCFCDDDECSRTPSGLFNLSKCQFGSPILLSWPHFFEADPSLLDDVIGLNPDQEKHQFFIDIQPKLGNDLRASARTQINLAMSPTEGISFSQGLREMIFPVAWFSDGIDGIDDEKTIELLQKAIFLPEKARSLMIPSLFGTGAVLLLLILVLLVLMRFHKKVKSKRVLQMNGSEAKNAIIRGNKNGFATTKYANASYNDDDDDGRQNMKSFVKENKYVVASDQRYNNVAV